MFATLIHVQLMAVGQVGLCRRHAMLLVVAERKNSIALVQIQNQDMEATLATEYREKNRSVQESLVRFTVDGQVGLYGDLVALLVEAE